LYAEDSIGVGRIRHGDCWRYKPKRNASGPPRCGKGVTFNRSLIDTGPDKDTSMDEISAPDTGSLPILIVEDNVLMRQILEKHLLELGFSSVTSAGNGRDALVRLDETYFPVVITDLVMPKLDGIGLCRAIRRNSYRGYIYIILLSSRDAKEDLIAGLDAGGDEYLVKPVNQAELAVRLKTARRILNRENSLRRSFEEIKLLAVKDPLTKLFNRGYLDERLPQEVKRTFRFERPLSVIMFDIDHFKAINDNFGHQVGDQVLRECADFVRRSVRGEIDWPARYGGEEFVVVLPETNLAGACVVAERLRRKISELIVVADGAEISFTASFGVASFTPPNQEEDLSMANVLIEKADQCLYAAKREGRNRVRSTEWQFSRPTDDTVTNVDLKSPFSQHD
jgi:two-component system cell cycle response regulator